MDTSDRAILRRLILGLTLVVLVGVVVWVFFVRDHGKKNTSNKSGSNTSQQTADDRSHDAAGSSGQQGSGPQAQGNPAPQGGSSPAGGQPNTLANTGPGNVALLFTGAAAAGALSHHLYSRRRAKSV